MKKTFSFKASNKTGDRQVDSIKHEIKKYLARERRKPLPESANVWDFDCKIGPDEKSATKQRVTELNQVISSLYAQELESFYLEIKARASVKVSKNVNNG